jgi:hypothetical protein
MPITALVPIPATLLRLEILARLRPVVRIRLGGVMAVGALIPIPALAAQEIPARLGAVVPGLRSKVVLEPAVIAIPAAIIRLEILTDGYRLLLNGATIHLLVLPSTRARHSHVVKTTPLIHLITRVATTGSGGHYFFMRVLYKPIHSNFILGTKLFARI